MLGTEKMEDPPGTSVSTGSVAGWPGKGLQHDDGCMCQDSPGRYARYSRTQWQHGQTDDGSRRTRCP